MAYQLNGTTVIANNTQVTANSIVIAANALVGVATQAEAQAGTATDKVMTPLRVSQAIATLAPSPNTASVANAYAGISALAIGSYIVGWNTSFTQANSNSTLAGSSIRIKDNSGTGPITHYVDINRNNDPNFPTTGTQALSGTWRALGNNPRATSGIVGEETVYSWYPSLWLRIV